MVFKYKVERTKYETSNDYERRRLFIKSMKPANDKSLDEYLIMSYIINNILNLHCKYPDIIQKKVEKYIKNFL
jgi:hypothetical protein